MRLTRSLFLRGAAATAAASLPTRLARAVRAAAGAPIRIGVLTDMSGNYRDPAGPGAVAAARMAVEEHGGTALGRPVEVLAADHRNKANVGSAIARRWFDQDRVGAVFEMVSSAVALAVQDIAREKGRISVATGAATSALTGKACSPLGMHWVYDTFALANATARELVRQGGDTWFFITADYAFGHALEADASALIRRNGGQVVGSVRHPSPNADFSSYLLQAQASGAKVIAFANAGQEFTYALTQANEFNIGAKGQRLAGLLVTISEAHALGPKVAQGLYLTEGFYWDLDDATRAWSRRFQERGRGRGGRGGAMPTSFQAGTYSAVLHYLRALDAAGTEDGPAVAAKMREMPVRDMFARGGRVRADGRMVHDMVFARIKSPAESRGEWDLYDVAGLVPGDQAFRPLSEGGCPLAAG